MGNIFLGRPEAHGASDPPAETAGIGAAIDPVVFTGCGGRAYPVFIGFGAVRLPFTF